MNVLKNISKFLSKNTSIFIMSFLCNGDVLFSVGMTTASTLLSPILTPVLVLALASE